MATEMQPPCYLTASEIPLNASQMHCMAAAPVVLLNCCNVAANRPHWRPRAHLAARPITLPTRTVPLALRAARFPPQCTATTRRPLGQLFAWAPNVHVQPSRAVPSHFLFATAPCNLPTMAMSILEIVAMGGYVGIVVEVVPPM